MKYTVVEAAEILKLKNPDSLRVYARRYSIGQKWGKQWLFSEDDIKKINSKRRRPANLDKLNEVQKENEVENKTGDTIELAFLADFLYQNTIYEISEFQKKQNPKPKESYKIRGFVEGRAEILNFLSQINNTFDKNINKQSDELYKKLKWINYAEQSRAELICNCYESVTI